MTSIANLAVEVRIERLRARTVEDENACWNWIGALNSKGYGCISTGGKNKNGLVHRVSYELHVGPIPDGLTIDHLCRNKVCVNPAHLEPVTIRTNIRRAYGYFNDAEVAVRNDPERANARRRELNRARAS